MKEDFSEIAVYSDNRDGSHPYELHNVSDHLREDISERLDIEVSVVDRFEDLNEDNLAESVEEIAFGVESGTGLEVGGYWVTNAESTLLDEGVEAVREGSYIDIKETDYRIDVDERRLYVEEFQEFGDGESLFTLVDRLDSEEELEEFAEENLPVTTEESI